jgi:hypothetical protein
MVKPGTKISRKLEGLEAMLGLPVLKVAVPERIGFTYASLQGYDTVTIEVFSLRLPQLIVHSPRNFVFAAGRDNDAYI